MINLDKLVVLMNMNMIILVIQVNLLIMANVAKMVISVLLFKCSDSDDSGGFGEYCNFVIGVKLVSFIEWVIVVNLVHPVVNLVILVFTKLVNHMV